MSDQLHDSTILTTNFARQPIFDSAYNVWGYELLFRHAPGAEHAYITDNDKATLDVAANSTLAGAELFGQSKMVMINFSQKTILDETPYALPPEQTVIELEEADLEDPIIASALAEYKKDGYALAVNLECDGRDKSELPLELADYLFVDVQGQTTTTVAALFESLGPTEAMLAAKCIEGLQELALSREMGFSLFQGFFFEKPETVEHRKLSSHEVSRFNLLQAIEEDNPDFDALAMVIQHDVAISYRLLHYLNSAAFNFSTEINTIKQAVVILGWKQLKNWLRIIILTDLSPGIKTKSLFSIAVQRGKFFELAARSHKEAKLDPDALFLLGLFSLLEPMLDMPMEQILVNLPLEEGLKTALTGGESALSPWLRLVHAYENAHWTDLDTMVDEMDLNSVSLSVSYYKSLIWSEAFFAYSQ